MSVEPHFPRMVAIRQKFPAHTPLDIQAVLEKELEESGIVAGLKPGARVAVGVGSRGIANLDRIVKVAIEFLKKKGFEPFIVPAMGSHGGATPKGQSEVLAGYGVTEETMGVPIQSSMAVKRLGQTEEGVEVHFSVEALGADGILPINRVKPHTDFFGSVGSGIQKMIAIGFAKREGAVACHAAASRLGHEHVVLSVSEFLLARVPILGGIAILENQYHDTHRLAVLKPKEIRAREETLLAEAKQLMPRLPFDEIDLLIVDRIGKDISGAGMDPNIVGRGVQGYSAALTETNHTTPVIRRIFVRDLTSATHGNAIGIGLADITTSRVVRGIDARATYINALSAVTPQTAKVPIHFETDREALTQVVNSLCLPNGAPPRVVRILDTLALQDLQVSEDYLEAVRKREDLTAFGDPEEMKFDADGNLTPFGAEAGTPSVPNHALKH